MSGPGIETAPPKKCLLARNDCLSDVLAKKLKEDCSPQQICGWLVSHYPDDEAMGVSAETIYRTLFVQAKGALKKELLAHLRSRRTMRSSRHASTSGPQARSDQRWPSRSVIARQRPKTVCCPDILGRGPARRSAQHPHCYPVRRQSSWFGMVVRLRGKDTESVVEALSNQIRRLPEAMMDTLSWDRATEMADPKKFTIATDVAVYFLRAEESLAARHEREY